MRKLAKFAAPALAAFAALGVTATATAQDWGGRYDRGYEDSRGYGNYGDRDDYRGNWRGGRGDWGQVQAFSRELDQLEQYAGNNRFMRERVWTLRNALRDWSRDGLSRHEAQTMRQQIDLTYRQARYGDRWGRRGW